MKLGIDPRNSTLHLGHFILLNKFNNLYKLNLKLILIIGNYTSYIGDPTNKITLRNFIKENFIKNNIKFYLNQIKILLKSKKIKIYYNNDWFKIFNLKDLIKLFLYFNLSTILNKKSFKYKYNNNLKLLFLELFYPILQSYDSFILKIDIELGGIDQKFNFVLTNKFLKKIKNIKQINFLSNLLIGTDKKKKMSKSFNNFISFKSNIFLFYKKFLKLSDKLIESYFNFFFFYKKEKKNIFIKNNIFFLKKKILNNLIIYLYNKKLLSLILSKNYKKIFKKYIIKFNLIKLYKIFMFFNILKSKNKFKFYLKQKSLKVNKVLIKNFNIILFKGFYLINFKSNRFYLKINF